MSVSERRAPLIDPKAPEPNPRAARPLAVELAQYLLSHIAPGEYRVVHVWTPELDLVLLRPNRGVKRRLRRKDLEALSVVVEKLCERAGRPAVVEAG